MANSLQKRLAIWGALFFVATARSSEKEQSIFQERLKHPASVNVFAFSDRGLLLSGCSSGMIQITELATGKTRKAWKAHAAGDVPGPLRSRPQGTLALALSLHGATVFSSGADGVFAWDSASQNKTILDQQEAAALALSPDGTTLAAIGYEGNIRFIDLSTLKVRKLDSKLQRGTAAVFSADGKTLYTGGVISNDTFPNCPVLESDRIRVWDVATGKEGPSLSGKAHRLARVGDRLLASGTRLRLETGPHARGNIKIDDTGIGVEHAVELWSEKTNNKLWSLLGHGDLVCLSPDAELLAANPSQGAFFEVGLGGGNSMAADSCDDGLAVFDVRSRQLVLSAGLGQATALAFDRHGKHLVFGARDGRVLVADLDVARSRFLKPLTPAETWKDLAEKPWPYCYRSLWRLSGDREAALKLFAAKMLVAPARDDGKIAQGIADLNSDRFEVRDRASKALESIGPGAVSHIRKALAAQQPLETTRRLQRLLERYQEQAAVTPGEVRRQLRAIAVLQEMNDPAARRLIAQIAEQSPILDVHRAASDALAGRKNPAKD